jgi:hypothetical protein
MNEITLAKELQNNAQWVANLMKADGVNAESVTTELSLAYLEEVGRKIAKIQNAYLTNPDARKSIIELVYSSLKSA